MKTLLKSLLILLFTASIGACNPMKVTDPNDPNFDPDKFSFRDYGEGKEMSLHEAFRRLFPPGTSKEFVEHVLVKVGGVEKYGCKENSVQSLCTYYYPQYMQGWKPNSRTSLIFDKNNKVITAGGASEYKKFHEEFYRQLREDQKNER